MQELPPGAALLGSSPQFQRTHIQIEKIARVEAPVLIVGETGTGKEMAARSIHSLSPRTNGPFIPVNCGALAETLIESELFGHERGAFTDAKAASAGLVSEANGGTLFLDEVDALSHKAQTALLRFLQDRTYRRVGSGTIRQADVRIIVATNANLEKMVEEKAFRRDLLYRLNVLMLKMPALRDRDGDALELAEIFLTRLHQQYGTSPKSFHSESLLFIQHYPWPGNIRELENLVHREFLMCEGAEILFDAIPKIQISRPLPYQESATFKEAKAQVIADFERRFVKDMLVRTQGNISRAAHLAGQDRSAFGKLVRKYGLHQGNIEQVFETSGSE